MSDRINGADSTGRAVIYEDVEPALSNDSIGRKAGNARRQRGRGGGRLSSAKGGGEEKWLHFGEPLFLRSGLQYLLSCHLRTRCLPKRFKLKQLRVVRNYETAIRERSAFSNLVGSQQHTALHRLLTAHQGPNRHRNGSRQQRMEVPRASARLSHAHAACTLLLVEKEVTGHKNIIKVFSAWPAKPQTSQDPPSSAKNLRLPMIKHRYFQRIAVKKMSQANF